MHNEKYRACVSRLDTNKDKQDYIAKYRALGWEEVKQTQSKNGNCENVTREMVDSGYYVMQEGQYFVQTGSEPSAKDELYEYYTDKNGSTKPRVVTCNNRTFFKKRINPLVTFWNWFTGLISIDHKNKVEDFKQWDPNTKTYLTEDYEYEFKFFYETSDGPVNDKIKYKLSSNDIQLEGSTISYFDENGSSVESLSVAGISLGVNPKDNSIASFNVEKVKDSNNRKKANLKVAELFEYINNCKL